MYDCPCLLLGFGIKTDVSSNTLVSLFGFVIPLDLGEYRRYRFQSVYSTCLIKNQNFGLLLTYFRSKNQYVDKQKNVLTLDLYNIFHLHFAYFNFIFLILTLFSISWLVKLIFFIQILLKKSLRGIEVTKKRKKKKIDIILEFM